MLLFFIFSTRHSALTVKNCLQTARWPGRSVAVEPFRCQFPKATSTLKGSRKSKRPLLRVTLCDDEHGTFTQETSVPHVIR